MSKKLLIGSVLLLSSVGNAYALDIPSQVPVAVRKACEQDVRRLCVRGNSTYASVHACVVKKFSKLNSRCKYRLVRAGFWSYGK